MVNMTTNPAEFAAIGGILLGIATSINYVLRGKVTGMSGIVYSIISLKIDQIPQKISIVGGLLLSGGLFFDIFGYGSSNGLTPFGPADQITSYTSFFGYAIAGILVGAGTKLSNGCTSGHGLCGLARLSLRSLIAILTFLVTAFVTGTFRYYYILDELANQPTKLTPNIQYNHYISANVFLIIGLMLPIIGGVIKYKMQKSKAQAVAQFAQWYKDKLQLSSAQQQVNNIRPCNIFVDQLITFIVGLIFGIGLLVAGMTRRINILSFVWINSNWNPSLLIVLGCGVIVNLVFFTYMIRVKQISVFGGKVFNPTNGTIDIKLISGAMLFGIGWGIAGLCPGPFMVMSAVWTIPIHGVWFVGLVFGMMLARLTEILIEKFQKKSESLKDINDEVKERHTHKIQLKGKNNEQYAKVGLQTPKPYQISTNPNYEDNNDDVQTQR